MHLSNYAATLGRALGLIADIDERDLEVMERLPIRTALFARGAPIIRQGDRPSECCLLVDGFICREKHIDDGERQILSFHLPGELPDLQSLHLERMDHGMVALAPSQVVFIPHRAIENVIDENPRIRAALWLATLVDASIFREWLAGVGARNAAQRAAHVFCEVYFRARMLGMDADKAGLLHLTHRDLGETLGLSSIHVSRLLNKLRAMDAILIRRGAIQVTDWAKLRRFSRFDPHYLHLRMPIPSDLALDGSAAPGV